MSLSLWIAAFSAGFRFLVLIWLYLNYALGGRFRDEQTLAGFKEGQSGDLRATSIDLDAGLCCAIAEVKNGDETWELFVKIESGDIERCVGACDCARAESTIELVENGAMVRSLVPYQSQDTIAKHFRHKNGTIPGNADGTGMS